MNTSYNYKPQVTRLNYHRTPEVDRTGLPQKKRFRYERSCCSTQNQILALAFGVTLAAYAIQSQYKQAPLSEKLGTATSSTNSLSTSVSNKVSTASERMLPSSNPLPDPLSLGIPLNSITPRPTETKANLPATLPQAPTLKNAQLEQTPERVNPVVTQQPPTSTELEVFYKNSILDSNPPLPNPSLGLNKEKAQQWIDAHHDSAARQWAAKFIETTRFVSHEEFEQHLKNCVQQFEKWYLPLRKEHTAGDSPFSSTTIENKFVIVTNEPSRSEHWVASLAIKYFTTLPDDVISYQDTKDYPAKHPEVTVFLFLDDAAYSCKQAQDTVNRFGSNIHYSRHRSNLSEGTVAFITPFVKAPHCMLPYKKATSDYISFHSEIIKPINELMNEEDVSNFVKLYSGIEHSFNHEISLENRFPIVFAHKIADSWSTFTSIYSRGLVSPKTLSLEEKESLEEKKTWWHSFIGKKEKHYTPIQEIPFFEGIVPPYKLKACEQTGDTIICFGL